MVTDLIVLGHKFKWDFPSGIPLCFRWYRGITSARVLIGISPRAPRNYFHLAPVWIAFFIRNPRRFLLGDSSLFSPVGVYLNSSFVFFSFLGELHILWIQSGGNRLSANKTVKVNPNGEKQGGISKKESSGISNNKSDPNGHQ